MWKVTNTTNDRMKSHLHRTASKMLDAPVVGELRLRVGQPLFIEDDQFEPLREQLDKWREKGMLDYCQVDENGDPIPGTDTADPDYDATKEPETGPMKKLVPKPGDGYELAKAKEESEAAAARESLDRVNDLSSEAAKLAEADSHAGTLDDPPTEYHTPTVNPEPWAEASTTPETPEPTSHKRGPKKKLF